jgi:hypothetical protein
MSLVALVGMLGTLETLQALFINVIHECVVGKNYLSHAKSNEQRGLLLKVNAALAASSLGSR